MPFGYRNVWTHRCEPYVSHGNMRVQLIHIILPAQDWPLSRHDTCLLAADLGCWGKEVVPAIAKICHSYVHMRCFVLTQGRENATVCVLRWVPVPLWIPFRHTLSLGLIKQTPSFVCPRWQIEPQFVLQACRGGDPHCCLSVCWRIDSDANLF